MTITALQNIPSITDPLNFNAENENLWNVQVPLMIQQINTDIQALNFGNLNATSTTSVLIGTGSKTFTIQTGRGWTGGMWGIAADAALPATNNMLFQVVSYNSGTGALVVDVKSISGSGTLTSWIVTWTPPAGITQTALDSTLRSQTSTGFTAAGTQPTYTVTTGYGALAAGQRLRVIFPTVTTFGAQATLNRDTLGAVNIVQYDANGIKQRGRILIVNQRCDLEYDGTDFVILNPIRNALIDLTGYSGADISLGIGEAATYTVTASTSQALRLATGNNQIYKRYASDTGAVAGVNASIELQINNVDYAGAGVLQQVYWNYGTNTWVDNTGSIARMALYVQSVGYVPQIESNIFTSNQTRKSVQTAFTTGSTTTDLYLGKSDTFFDNAVNWTSMGTEQYGRSWSGIVTYVRVK